MASSSNRKSNSSASRAAKPTFRKATTAQKRPVSKSAPASRPASVPAPKKPISAYTAPSRKTSSRVAASVKAKRPAKQVSGKGPAPRGLQSVPAKPAAAPASGKGIKKAGMRKAAVPTLNQSIKKGARPVTARALNTPAPQAAPAKEPRPAGKIASGAKAIASKLPVPRVPRAAVAAVLLGVLALAVAAIVILNSGLFAATEIKIEGSVHVTQEQAEQLIDIKEGTTLFNVNEAELSSALKKNPWVSGVDIEREFPHTLVITPHERTVIAIAYIAADDIAWAIGDDSCWIAPMSLSVYVDADGNVVDDVEPVVADSQNSATQDGATQDADAQDQADTAATALPEGITALSGKDAAEALAKQSNAILLCDVSADVSPSSGDDVTSDLVLDGIAYAKGFTPEFVAQIKDISIASEEAISANLDSGVEVALGPPDDIALKERVVTQLLQQEQGVTFINVRTPNAYTFRSVPA